MSSLMYIEGHRDVAEALATTCAGNTNLKQLSMARLPTLPVMKSLFSRKAPLDELVMMCPLVSFMILSCIHMTPG